MMSTDHKRRHRVGENNLGTNSSVFDKQHIKKIRNVNKTGKHLSDSKVINWPPRQQGIPFGWILDM